LDSQSKRSRAENLKAIQAAFSIGANSLCTGVDQQQASIFLEMIKADKFGLLTNDINQLKKELKECYL